MEDESVLTPTETSEGLDASLFEETPTSELSNEKEETIQIGDAEVPYREVIEAYTNKSNWQKSNTQKAQELAKKYDLKLKISYSEKFAATTNTEQSVELIQKAATKLGLKYQNKEKPFSWSEDFGQFTQRFEGAMFGLGSGKNTPKLHHSNYDFPDDITQTGIDMFVALIQNSEIRS